MIHHISAILDSSVMITPRLLASLASEETEDPMTLRSLALAAVAAAVLASPALAAGTVQGDWLTQSGSGKVRIAPCGSKLCGAIVWLKNPNDKNTGRPQLDEKNPDPALRKRPIQGLQILSGFKPGPGKLTGGAIYDPQSGKTYVSKLSLNPDGTLKVEGCIAIICQAQTWKPAS
jgi:uncharacterized protein (DUF2147 family)